MRSRRPLVLACLLAAAVAPARTALAQAPQPAVTSVAPPVNPGDAELDGGVAPPTGTTPPGTTPFGVAPDDAQSLPPASTTEAPGGAGPAGVTPGPPSYLAPGPGAQVQPVAAVAELDSADVPLEPLRLAALIAALAAVILLGVATLTRALGIRTVATPAVPDGPHGGGSTRVRERITAVADDVRDFLRHSR